MRGDLIEHIKGYLSLEATEAQEIMASFQAKTYAKKELLQRAQARCDRLFFVVSGCLRMFLIGEKGVEHTLEFAIENWWITDLSNFGMEGNTDLFIQAVERTEVLAIDPKGLEALFLKVPKMERYFRLIHRRAHAAAQSRTKFFFGMSREEMYHKFNESYPEFTQRVPQQLLASFLNMTPEYLSGIKAKKRS